MKKKTTKKVSRPAEAVKPSKPKTSLDMTVIVDAPWGKHEFGFVIPNAACNVARTKMNEKAWRTSLLHALHAEYGTVLKPK